MLSTSMHRCRECDLAWQTTPAAESTTTPGPKQSVDAECHCGVWHGATSCRATVAHGSAQMLAGE